MMTPFGSKFRKPYHPRTIKVCIILRKLFYVDGTHIAVETIGKGIPNGSMLEL